MSGIWLSMAVNPKPLTDVGDAPAARNWAALNQNGVIMVSHGLKVPHDTPDQPVRPANVGGWATPRWGWVGATAIEYVADVGRGLMVYDWIPDDLKGYAFDSYGALWPFGSDTPMAATGAFGAPFGVYPLNAYNNGTIYNGFQMHSANNLPFGKGGWPDGFGWFISQDGVIIDWGGPISVLTQPFAVVPTDNFNGTPGSGDNRVRDFKVNPANSGQFYVLYDSGLIYAGCAAGGSPVAVISAQPSASPMPLNGYRWMHVDWDEGWIISMTGTGDVWGYRLAGGIAPPPIPTPHPTWYNPSTGSTSPSLPGVWQSGDIVPGRGPSRFYIINWVGAALAPAITGVIQALNPTVAGATTTTQPTVNWTYNELAGAVSVGSQKSYSIRIYTQQYISDQGGAFVAGQNAGAVEIHDIASATPTHHVTRNLRNGIAFRAYVRVTSAANVTSPWASVDFTMNIPLPATPSSCVATIVPGTWPSTLGTVSIAAGGGLGAGELRQFQVSANNSPFIDVFQASATTLGTVTDPFPQTNVSLVYRVRSFKRVPAQVPSAWRTASPVILTPPVGMPQGWRIIDVGPAGAGPIVILDLDLDAGPSFEGQKPQGEFQPLTQEAKIVTSAGRKGDDHTITVHCWNQAGYLTAYQDLYKMLSLTRPLLFFGLWGRSWWVSADGGNWKTLALGSLATETTKLRDAHDVTVRLVNVLPPR